MLRWPIFFNSTIISGVEQFQCRHDNSLKVLSPAILVVLVGIFRLLRVLGPNIFQLWLLFFRFSL